MSNMSYCRFQNTLSDLKDCAMTLEDGVKLSRDENVARRQMFELMCDMFEAIGVDVDNHEVGDALRRFEEAESSED